VEPNTAQSITVKTKIVPAMLFGTQAWFPQLAEAERGAPDLGGLKGGRLSVLAVIEPFASPLIVPLHHFRLNKQNIEVRSPSTVYDRGMHMLASCLDPVTSRKRNGEHEDNRTASKMWSKLPYSNCYADHCVVTPLVHEYSSKCTSPLSFQF
jgi:hypothetical protein